MKVTILLLLTAAVAYSIEPWRPVVLAQRGESFVSEGETRSRSLKKGDSLPAGAQVDTSESGRTAIALAPGQLVTLRESGRLNFERLHDDAGSAQLRLSRGTLACHIDKSKPKDQPSFDLLAGNQKLCARGTLWTTTVAPDGSVFTSVLHSTVTLKLGENAEEIAVQAGRVVISRYTATGVLQQTSVIDLTTGQKMVIIASSPATPISSLATTVELGEAAGIFQQALNTAAGWTSDTIVATQLLISQINAVLTMVALPPLTNPDYRSANGDTLSDNRDTLIASPDAPPGGM